MGYLISPDGSLIVGTAELIPGTAILENVSKDAEGELCFDYSGETDVDWNGQETVTKNDQIVVVDECGDEYLLSECTYHEGNPEDYEPPKEEDAA